MKKRSKVLELLDQERFEPEKNKLWLKSKERTTVKLCLWYLKKFKYVKTEYFYLKC